MCIYKYIFILSNLVTIVVLWVCSRITNPSIIISYYLFLKILNYTLNFVNYIILYFVQFSIIKKSKYIIFKLKIKKISKIYIINTYFLHQNIKTTSIIFFTKRYVNFVSNIKILLLHWSTTFISKKSW